MHISVDLLSIPVHVLVLEGIFNVFANLRVAVFCFSGTIGSPLTLVAVGGL